MSEPQEPPVTYEHVIGVKELEIFMLRREIDTLQRQLAAATEPTKPEDAENTNGTDPAFVSQ